MMETNIVWCLWTYISMVKTNSSSLESKEQNTPFDLWLLCLADCRYLCTRKHISVQSRVQSRKRSDETGKQLAGEGREH